MIHEQSNIKFEILNRRIITCKKCPRLTSYIKTIAKQKVKRFKHEKYWGKPIPGFGDINAELLIIGLAPAAHGGNRTGRMFTGDSSGDWLAKVLYDNGFATKPTSEKLNDGFELCNAYITAAVRCAPPKNKPTKEEFENCSIYLAKELSILKNTKVIICLGKLAFDSFHKVVGIKNSKFSHGNMIKYQNWSIICSYHPSRQNTQTGRMKWKQWNSIFVKARKIIKNN